MAENADDNADWNLATWEGAQRESLRRWAKLPLESIIAALEEMQELNEALHGSDSVQEQSCDYGTDKKK